VGRQGASGAEGARELDLAPPVVLPEEDLEFLFLFLLEFLPPPPPLDLDPDRATDVVACRGTLPCPMNRV
jgi:hypothetical protein